MNQDALAGVAAPLLKLLATRLLFGLAAVVVSFVVAYHYLVDRTLQPLALAVASIETDARAQAERSQSSLSELQGSLSDLSRAVGRLEGQLNGLQAGTSALGELKLGVADMSDRSKRIEDRLTDVFEPQLAWFYQEQRDITERIIRLERHLIGDQGDVGERKIKEFEDSFDQSLTRRWDIGFVPGNRDEGRIPLVVVTPSELIGLGDFDVSLFLKLASTACGADLTLNPEYQRSALLLGEYLQGLRDIILAQTGRVDIFSFERRDEEITSSGMLDNSEDRLYECMVVDLISDFVSGLTGNSVSTSAAVSDFQRKTLASAFVRKGDSFQISTKTSRNTDRGVSIALKYLSRRIEPRTDAKYQRLGVSNEYLTNPNAVSVAANWGSSTFSREWFSSAPTKGLVYSVEGLEDIIVRSGTELLELNQSGLMAATNIATLDHLRSVNVQNVYFSLSSVVFEPNSAPRALYCADFYTVFGSFSKYVTGLDARGTCLYSPLAPAQVEAMNSSEFVEYLGTDGNDNRYIAGFFSRDDATFWEVRGRVSEGAVMGKLKDLRILDPLSASATGIGFPLDDTCSIFLTGSSGRGKLMFDYRCSTN